MSEEITFKELIQLVSFYFQNLKKKWLIILTSFIIGGAIGLYMAYNAKPQYTAELIFALDESGGGGYSSLASQFGLDVGSIGSSGAFVGDNNIELLKSRRLIEKTLLTPVLINGKSVLLINRFIESNNLRELWEKTPEMNKLLVFKENDNRDNYCKEQDSVIYDICKQLKFGSIEVSRLEKRLALINIKVKSGDELFAKLFEENLVQNAMNYYIETKTKKYNKNVMVLEQKLDSVRNALNNDISNVATLKDRNQAIIRAQGGVQLSKKQMNVQILTTMYSELVKNLEIAKYTLLKEQPNIQIIDMPRLPLESKKLGKKRGFAYGAGIGAILSILGVSFFMLRKSFLNK